MSGLVTGVSSVFGRTGAVVAASGDYTTTQVTEGTNLYYTEARVSANTDVAANTAARHAAVTLGTANGLSLSTQQLSLGLASGSATGALSSTDWNTFNNKQAALTIGNITSADTSVMTISGGTGAIIGSGVSLTLLAATGSNGGIVTTGTQTFAGAKTFTSALAGTSATFVSTAATNNAARYNVSIGDNSAVAAGNGGGILFRGVYTGTTLVDAAGISSFKANGTDGDYGYGLSFVTRANGGDLTSRLTIASTGAAIFSSNLVAINGNGLTELKINNNTSEWELYMPSGSTDLRFYRGNDKMTLTSNGGVNIGTNNGNSISKLNIQSDATRFIAFEAIASSGNKTIYIRPVDSGIHLISSNYISSGPYLPLAISARENNADLYLAIDGKIGIGTNNPQASLHIVGSGSGNVLRLTSKDNAGDNWVGFYKADGTRQGYLGYGFSASDEFEIYQEANAPILFSTNSIERMRILSNGVTEIKSYGANLNLKFVFEGGDQINTLNSGSGTAMYMNYSGNGAIYAGAGAAVTLYAGSDERIKKNINIVDSTLSKVLQLIPKTFNYKDVKNTNLYYGFTAQDMELVFPELVKTAQKDSTCNDEIIKNQKSIESFGLVWASILTKAIQELKVEIDELKNK